MNYTLEWVADAEDDLADAWLQADDPQAVNAAQVHIERLLARDPIGTGQHLHEGLYQIVVKPLTVLYSVDTSQH
jgi:hypothetical protein